MERKGSGLSVHHCIPPRNGVADPSSVESYPHIRRSEIDGEVPVIHASGNRSSAYKRQGNLHAAFNTICGFDQLNVKC